MALTQVSPGLISTVANTQITGVITSSQLANTAVTTGVYGGSAAIPVITVGSDGRITSAANTTLNAASTGKAIAMALVFGG